MNAENEKDRESYMRWQEIALTQLGYTINLFLTLAGVAISFALKILMESRTPFPALAHWFFYVALLLLGLSIAAALCANVTRALDFRYTRRAARERMKQGKDHDKYHNKAECLGEWTWWLFLAQTGAVLLGVVFLTFSLCFVYGNRI
jgi:hypothetical protein